MRRDDVVVLPSRDDLVRHVADELRRVVAEALASQHEAHLVLTGGSVGIAVLDELGAHNDGRVDWTRVHLWWGDERWVAAGGPERNDAGAQQGFLDRLDFDSAHIHRMPAREAGLDIDTAAMHYQSELLACGGGKLPVFDLVLLGMGPDAHIASLFPEQPALDARDGDVVVAVGHSPKPPPERLTLTLSALNTGRRVWIVAAGEDKAHAVRHASSPIDARRYPASAVAGTLESRLFCDEAAARELTRP